MSGFIKTIKNLFSSILSFFVGLLGGKKSQESQPSIKAADELPGKVTGKTRRRSGYFLELDEAEETKPVETSQSGNGAAAKTPELVTNAKATKKEEPAKTSESVTTAKATKKEEPAKTPEPAAAQTAKVELVQTAEGVKAEPTKPAKVPAASANGQNQTEKTFAPKYLIPSSSNGRRRPGPNMNPFLDMARQVNSGS